jgi:amino acid transporter
MFYIISLTVVGLLVPYTDSRLLSADSQADAKASPFVIAIKNAGIAGMDSVMNVVIMIAVLSVGNSSIYGSSRTLAALAEQRQAPHFLAYIDRRGRPLCAIFVAAIVGLLGFMAASTKKADALAWMIAICGLSSILTWGSICLAHIRFRHGWKAQGRSLDDLPFRSQPGVIGSYLGVIINVLILIAQFWTAIYPVHLPEETAAARVQSWFSLYLTLPVIICFYFPYKFWFRTSFIRAADMDLKTGRRDLDLVHLIAEERAERAAWPRWKKFYRFFC